MFEKYLRYFRLTTTSSVGDDMPRWRSRYRPSSRDGHPPLVFVFNPGTRIGPQALKNRMSTVLKGTRPVWSGDYQADRGYGSPKERDGYYDFTDEHPRPVHHPGTPAGRRAARNGVVAVRPWPVGDPPRRSRQPGWAWDAREKVRRARYDEEVARRERERAAQEERWAAQPAPVPEVAPCERCGLPVTGQAEDEETLFAPPEAGRHCLRCRSGMRQYPTLRSTLFGLRLRSK
ncbi:hypothetical protein [Streptomyces sp. NPDC127036]|uniref:hypothetical protein n=1 Tax=unclassified Streptomyces TaxID=2593676 RepID=UPI0036535C2D